MILFDPCSTHNFVSVSFAEWFNLLTMTGTDEVEMGNGSIENTPGNTTLTIKIDDYEDSLEFGILKLSSRNDTIIGKPWFYDMNPQIDFRNDTIWFKFEQNEIFLCWMKDLNPPKMNSEWTKLLHEDKLHDLPEVHSKPTLITADELKNLLSMKQNCHELELKVAKDDTPNVANELHPSIMNESNDLN